jgi:TonB family protein
MLTGHWLKVAAISLIALQAGLSSTQAQRRGLEAQVQTGTPPGLIKKVEPEYPPDVVMRHADGGGLFRLTINPRSGEVDEVKIVKSCGYKILNELAAKALLQWRFQPGSRGPVEVPVDFYVHGGSRRLH